MWCTCFINAPCGYCTSQNICRICYKNFFWENESEEICSSCLEEFQSLSLMPIVMQTRCVHCKREQYWPAVFEISQWLHGCIWCGKIPKVYTSHTEYDADYKEK